LSERGGLTSTEQRRFESLMAEANVLKEQIERVESAHYEIRGFQPDGYLGSSFEQRDDTREKEHRSAFISYLRSGLSAMPPEQRTFLQKEFRDMGSGGQGAYPGASAGYFVPVGFVAEVIEALKYYGPLLDGDVVDIMDTATGAPLPIPVDNDTTIVGELIGENQQVTSQDVNIGQIVMGAYKYSSRMVKVSLELLQDSAFALEPYLIKKFAIRLGRILVSNFTIGTGTNMPMGIITATLANGALVSAVGSSSNTGNADGKNTIGTDDLTNLIHSIDPLYRTGGSFMMHDSTLQALLRLKDKFGRPILDPNVQNPSANTYLGYPIRINNFMDQLEVTPSSPPVTRNSVVFGSFKRYLVRRVKEISVLRLEERFADYGQIGFLAFARFDATPAFGGTGPAFPFALLQNTY
jgi:HK97 family phage major capsid protein